MPTQIRNPRLVLSAATALVILGTIATAAKADGQPVVSLEPVMLGRTGFMIYSDRASSLSSLPVRRVITNGENVEIEYDTSAPPRMVVTWLDRSRRTGDPGTGRACAPGQALARAVAAWAGEMLCADEHGTTVFLLGGYLGTADIFDHLTGGLGLAPESVHVPARFGLTAGR